MRNNIAILDLGSNLTKLVVVEKSLPLQVLHRSVYDTKTLKSAPKGYFDAVSISRIEQDIEKILNVAAQFNCTTILGIATSAFRTRENGKEVMDSINTKFGINIQIIEGEREAHLIYKGALASVKPSHFPVMVMDIGGGSTEFIIGTDTAILWKHSFNFGSTALTKDFNISNPISKPETLQLIQLLKDFLPSLFDAINKFNPTALIGTTGAFESFAQLIESKQGNSTPVASGYSFQNTPLTDTLDMLIESTTAERIAMGGMNLLRVDTIPIAALIFKFVRNATHFTETKLSLGDVKEGLALEYLEK
tara:strand:- start:10482 stop:11399 length:918 start_codon:yes stop_codon:yes gene_type:complete